MSYIKFDSSKLDKFVHANELEQMQPLVTAADKELREGTGAGKDFRGFLDLPVNYDKDEFARIKAAAKKIQGNSQVFVAIGIGGSYLGARMAVDFLSQTFRNLDPELKFPEVYFAVNEGHLLASQVAEAIEVLSVVRNG